MNPVSDCTTQAILSTSTEFHKLSEISIVDDMLLENKNEKQVSSSGKVEQIDIELSLSEPQQIQPHNNRFLAPYDLTQIITRLILIVTNISV
jgi:hypothetical protein